MAALRQLKFNILIQLEGSIMGTKIGPNVFLGFHFPLVHHLRFPWNPVSRETQLVVRHYLNCVKFWRSTTCGRKIKKSWYPQSGSLRKGLKLYQTEFLTQGMEKSRHKVIYESPWKAKKKRQKKKLSPVLWSALISLLIFYISFSFDLISLQHIETQHALSIHVYHPRYKAEILLKLVSETTVSWTFRLVPGKIPVYDRGPQKSSPGTDHISIYWNVSKNKGKSHVQTWFKNVKIISQAKMDFSVMLFYFASFFLSPLSHRNFTKGIYASKFL